MPNNIMPDTAPSDQSLIRLLKIIMISGFCLILLGVYFHMFSPSIHALGVKGMVISACCVAIGMIMSLPTKMFLTFILVKREDDKKHQVDTYKIK